MKEIEATLKEIGSKSGLDIALDENGACTLELSDGRVMLIQERSDLDELDFVAGHGRVVKVDNCYGHLGNRLVDIRYRVVERIDESCHYEQ